ncbi:MAG: hypothetical protein AB1344_00680 [Pseudomonadota bacterium]
MMQKRLLLAALMAASTSPAMAGDIAAGLVAGTAGFGAEVTYGVAKDFNLRGTLRGLDYDYDFTEDNIDYEGNLKLRNGGVTVDWFPFSGSFRLSAGAMYNGNEVKAKAKPNTLPATYTINDVDYVIDGQVDASIDWRKFAPYVGIGWGNAVGKGSNWSVSFDLGVMFTGEPNTDLTATGTVNGIPVEDDAQFQSDLAAERNNLNDEIKDAKFYPVIQLGLHYKF